MRHALRTLEDLRWAQENDPALIEEVRKEAAVLPDLEKWLRYLSDEEVDTKVISHLRRNKRRSLGIHPSSACKQPMCLLKMYYHCTGEMAPLRKYEEKSQNIWDLGTLLHDLHQVQFERMFEDQFEKEVFLKHDPYLIKSNTDGVFDFVDYRMILELKSIKDGGNFGWDKVQDKPFDDNVRQSIFYMWLADIPLASIFYMGKNRGEYKEHVIVFDFNIWEEIETQVVQPTVASVAAKTKPEALPGWHCRQCDYNSGCEPSRRHRNRAKSKSKRWRC